VQLLFVYSSKHSVFLMLSPLPQVAVKVLDGHAVLRRDETTGFCLEALLSQQLKVRGCIET
jgi:hypothetical protein